jgi:Domain of unknown function (DUF6048)
MKMKFMSKYYFSALMVLFSILSNAQNDKKIDKPTDSIKPKTERYGVRFGIDAFKLAKSIYDKNYKGIELVGDYRLSKNYYVATELGNDNKTVDEDQLNFTSKGSFIKVGFDYNSYENWLDMENMVYIGVRYGIATFSQTINSYKVYDPGSYFGQSGAIESGEKYDGLSAQWAEIVTGIKAKVINNVYVGFNFRINKLVVNNKPDGFDNLYIPGFNRTYSGDFGVGFNYSVSYFLPLYKSVSKPKLKDKKAEEKAIKK